MLRSPHGVGHRGAARPEWLFGPNGGVPSRLMFYFGIELCAEQNDDRGHPHPHHGPDGRAERTIRRVIVGEIGKVV